MKAEFSKYIGGGYFMTNRKDWQTSVSVYAYGFSAELMESYSKSGINYIELTAGDYSIYDGYTQKADEIFNTAKQNGVTIRSIHLPFSPFKEIDPAHLEKGVRDKFLEIQKPILYAAAKSGIEIAVIHPSGEPYREENRPTHLANSIECLSELQLLAKENGIKLAVENLPRTCIGRDSFDMLKIFEAIPEAFACFDANHSLKENNVDLIHALGERIITLHISDYDFIDERHLFPGEGKNCWQNIMKALEEVNYNGTWNYEVKNGLSHPAEKFKQNHNNLLNGTIK